MKSSREIFIEEIEACLKELGLSAYTFGMNFNNDPNFVQRVRNGRSPRLDTMDACRQHMKLLRDRAAIKRSAKA